MHLDDEALHAYLDRSLADAEHAVEHLNSCGECRARLEAVQARAARVDSILAVLDPSPSESPRSAQLAFAQLTARRLAASQKQGANMLKTILTRRLRPLWIGVSIVVLFAAAFSYPPVRAWATDLLAQFRVQKVAILPVDSTRLTQLGGDTALGQQISRILSASLSVTKEPGEPQAAANAAQASQMAGFTVRLPASRSDAPQLAVQGGSAFQFTVDRARAQSLLNDSGFSRLQLPASIDGAVIKIELPAGVSAAYGDCPSAKEAVTEIHVSRDPDGDRVIRNSSGRVLTSCVALVQMPSPIVDAPADLDVQSLAEIGMQFAGMTPEEARKFSQTVDWTSTLVIPIPRRESTHKQVSVDGVTGYMIERSMDAGLQYGVVWVKHGIIYAIGGWGDPAQALEMAKSLK